MYEFIEDNARDSERYDDVSLRFTVGSATSLRRGFLSQIRVYRLLVRYVRRISVIASTDLLSASDARRPRRVPTNARALHVYYNLCTIHAYLLSSARTFEYTEEDGAWRTKRSQKCKTMRARVYVYLPTSDRLESFERAFSTIINIDDKSIKNVS